MAYAEKAFAIAPKQTGVLNSMSYSYARAGWIKEAVGHARRGAAIDPLEAGQFITLGFLQLVLGDLDASEETFLHVWDDLGVKSYFSWEGLFQIYLLRGNYVAAQNWLEVRPVKTGSDIRSQLVAVLRDPTPAARSEFVAELVAQADSGQLYLPEIFDYLLALDAVDEAYGVAKRGIERGDFFMPHNLYLPFAEPLRRDARALSLAHDLGLADLWRATDKFPDFCREREQRYDCKTVLAQLSEADPKQ
jgi:hypothetical protein